MFAWWNFIAESVDPRILAVVVGAIVISGSLTLWIRFLVRAVEGQSLLPYEPRRPVPWIWVDLIVLLLVFLGALWTFLALYLYFYPRSFGPSETEFPPVMLLVDAATKLAVLLAALVGLKSLRGATPLDWGLVSANAGRDVLVALTAAVAFLPPVYALHALLSRVNDTPHPLIKALTEWDEPWLRVLAFLSAGLLAPIWEELFFRVLFQGWLERVLVHRHEPPPDDAGVHELTPDAESTGQYVAAVRSPRGGWLPIAISSALFALAHLNYESPRLDFIPLFFFSCGLGYLYQRTHRALPSILLHMALNVCSLTLLVVAASQR